MDVTNVAFPELMVGKKILYVHGFASSGQTGTVKGLRMLLPKAEVIAPDLPVHPAEAMQLLRKLCEQEQPDLIIGTSMGGMYAEMLYGYDRILLNPAFQMAETLTTNNTMGRQAFHNPRLDGIQDFLVTKSLIAEYKEMTEQCFCHVTDEERKYRVYGLFGDKDPLVHTFPLFSKHYLNAIHFDGEHYMNDSILLNSVIPVIRWIDDRQEHRERPILYISMDDTLADYKNGWRKLTENTMTEYEGHLYDVPGFYALLEPVPTAVKGFHTLARNYDVYILSDAPCNNPTAWSDKLKWCERWLGVPSYGKLIIGNHKNLSYGDYLIDSSIEHGAADFMGTFIHFGEDPYKTWEDILTFFSRLGGQ